MRRRTADRKILTLVALIAVLSMGAAVAAGCGSGGETTSSVSVPTPSSTATTVGSSTDFSTTTGGPMSTTPGGGATVLEVTSATGTKSFTLDDLKAMPAVDAFGGIKNSAGNITPPVEYKGVAVTELLKTVGGLPAGTGVSFIAKDGYEMTMSAEQVQNGKFVTYDVSTGDEIKVTDSIQLVLAYENQGKPLNADQEGAVRLAILTAKGNEVTDGHWWVKWVTKVDVKALAADWSLALSGAIQDKVDRGTFDSCAAPNCHGVTWKDDKAVAWTGVPLYYLAGRVDDQTKHGFRAFNSDLAAKGYKIEVVGAGGNTVSLDSSAVAGSKDYIVAYKMEGNVLGGTDAPLRLVGPGLKADQSVGGIKEIRLLIK